MIKTIIRCTNNMVLVFNEKGEQIPQYQGQYEAVRQDILKDAPSSAVFGLWYDPEHELRKMPRENW